MPVKKILLLILVFVFVCFAALNADTLYLKNGRSIEGLIKNEDTDANIIELEVCAGTVKFKKSEIERIEKSTPEESSAIRQKWERQKKEAQDRIFRQQLEEERRPKKIEFSQDKPFIILDVTLNKKVEASLVLDTGSSVILLRKNIAEKLGIDLEKVKTDAKLILADGRQVNAKNIILESVKAQGVEAKNVEATIILDEVEDLGFGDGLLGMSFLKRFNFKVDQKNKKLILEKL